MLFLTFQKSIESMQPLTQAKIDLTPRDAERKDFSDSIDVMPVEIPSSLNEQDIVKLADLAMELIAGLKLSEDQEVCHTETRIQQLRLP